MRWILEAIAFALLCAVCYLLLSAWPSLPERVPVHFGFSGRPNAWGSKSILLLLPVVGIVVYASTTLAALSAKVRNALTVLALLKVEALGMLAYVVWQTVRVARGEATGMGAWFVLVPLGLVVPTVIALGLSARKRP